jgi:hypothetical protein
MGSIRGTDLNEFLRRFFDADDLQPWVEELSEVVPWRELFQREEARQDGRDDPNKHGDLNTNDPTELTRHFGAERVETPINPSKPLVDARKPLVNARKPLVKMPLERREPLGHARLERHDPLVKSID